MGGDHGPLSTIPAALAAVEEFPLLDLILCGDTDLLQPYLDDAGLADHPGRRCRRGLDPQPVAVTGGAAKGR